MVVLTVKLIMYQDIFSAHIQTTYHFDLMILLLPNGRLLAAHVRNKLSSQPSHLITWRQDYLIEPAFFRTDFRVEIMHACITINMSQTICSYI